MIKSLLIFTPLLLLSACVGITEGDPDRWYEKQNVRAPKADKVYVCHGTGCALRVPVQLTSQDLTRLGAIMKNGNASPQAERDALSKAVVWFEKRIAPSMGSQNDVGGFDFSTVNKPGQLDCIDEATNTTTLLKVAQKNGFLKHHSIGRPMARGFFLDGRYPHATAVVKEKQSGTSYAIDSWVHDNAQPPDILLLSEWMKLRASDLT